MLSRPSASKASRSCCRDLLRTTHSPTARPFGRSANFSSQPHSRHRPSPVLRPISDGHAKWSGRRLTTDASQDRRDAVYASIDQINRDETEMAKLMDDLDLLDDFQGALNYDGPDPEEVMSRVVGYRNEQALEAKVQAVRQEFGDHVPEGYLNDAELEMYTRLYGEPIIEEELVEEEEEEERDPDRLYRQDAEGRWEEIEQEEPPVAYDMEAAPVEEETAVMQRAREVAKELDGELMLEQSLADGGDRSFMRLHPLSKEAQFRTDPASLPMPRSLTGPVSTILSDYSNTHLYEAAWQIFGGRRLPHSTTTLPPKFMLPQLPIPLKASHRHMTEMESNAFLAVLYPGIYASAVSILTEVRKRMGTDWIRGLISKEGGPHVLDVGGGGAGIIAWRHIIRAEWESMHPDHTETAPIPMGKSTVVTGSDTLQVRASAILDNTTFLPRLPDYVHVRDKPTLDDEREAPKRKQYDIIIAPHNLLDIEEDFMRKEHVENLWSLLNPDGGILVLFEKGRQKGFEAVAGAREMILNRYISSPGSSEYPNTTESADARQYIAKETGMIVAPCTNHEQCPMYRIPGPVKGRSDYCHFAQRYYRPDFLQRIKGVLSSNHEDVEFSYIAVQRGADLRKHGVVQGPEATDAAFAGYEHVDSDTEPRKFHTLSLPRSVYPPLKRKGHVIMDFCTPAGQIERWTVPRSFSRQAFRDARKSRWGDLWALGAKTRIPRTLKIGSKDGEGKKERLAKRAAAKAAMRVEADADLSDEPSMPRADEVDPSTLKKRGERVPRWKKKNRKRKARQSAKDAAAMVMSAQ